MRMGPVSFFLVLAAAPAAPLALAAQWQASVGAGTGLVRSSGGSTFSPFTVSPAAQTLTPSLYAGASGAVSLLEAGGWASQGRADVWSAVLGRLSSTRVAVSGTVGFSSRSDGVAAGSGSALIEAVRDGVALGAGVVSGVIQQQPGVAAFRVRGRAWWLYNAPTQLSLTAEATRLLGAWYTDVVGGVSFDANRTVASLWLSGRFTATYGSTGAASASVQYFLTPTVAVEASGGNYLRDPFQGLPVAGFITGGIRVFASRRTITPPPRGAGGPGGTGRSTLASAAKLQPLVAQHRGGDTVAVRFRMPNAHAVAIAGNWNGWTPAPLNALGNDIWEAVIPLPPGTYNFNLVVDGTDWVVPGGVATISDGMGGLLAVLNVL
jgi:hypothetical protein